MGFIGGLIKTIFSPSVASAQSQQTTLTGRDLLESTSSESPDAPVMGSDKKDKRKGVNSLLVPTNDLYKGGIS